MKKPILLHTKQVTNLIVITCTNILVLLPEGFGLPKTPFEYQHLYIIDTEAEIKKGDWFLNKSNNIVYQSKGYGVAIGVDEKIIATTDKSLNLPLINKEFIQLFVEKQGKIEEVEVKIEDQGCEEWQGDDYNGQPVWNEKLVAIVTPKESDDVESAALKYASSKVQGFNQSRYYTDAFEAGAAWQKKRMYSKDEVIEIIYKSSYVLAHGDSTKQDADEWISQNLKK